MERRIFESYHEVSHPLITVLIRVGNLSMRTMWYVVAGEVVVDADQRKVLFVHVAVPPADNLRKTMSRHEACLPVRCLQRSIRFTLVSTGDCSGDFVGSCNEVDLRRGVRNSLSRYIQVMVVLMVVLNPPTWVRGVTSFILTLSSCEP